MNRSKAMRRRKTKTSSTPRKLSEKFLVARKREIVRKDILITFVYLIKRKLNRQSRVVPTIQFSSGFTLFCRDNEILNLSAFLKRLGEIYNFRRVSSIVFRVCGRRPSLIRALESVRCYYYSHDRQRDVSIRLETCLMERVTFRISTR